MAFWRSLICRDRSL